MKILVINAGSSSVKASLRDVGELGSKVAAPIWRADASWGRNSGRAEMKVSTAEGASDAREIEFGSPSEIFRPVIRSLLEGPCGVVGGAGEVAAVGHRVVHGGSEFSRPTRINREVRAAICRYAEFAPEHNALEVAAMEAVDAELGLEVPQVAVFDTAFHRTMPAHARTYPIPIELYEQGVQRYGFHGISHQYVGRRCRELLGAPEHFRIISCHLGNGASVTAIQNGRSVDTSMGFTPLEGIMMGTRSGSIDPALVIYLCRHRGYSIDDVERLLNKDSGLKGVSGVSGDMRDVIARMGTEPRAQLAFDIYSYRLRREIGAMTAVLGGVDAIAFAGGIGENCAPLREAVWRQLSFLGVEVDSGRNEATTADTEISASSAKVRVVVIRTEEEWEIASECRAVLERSPLSGA